MNNNIQKKHVQNLLQGFWRVRIVVLIILLCSNSISAAGILDKSFGVGGKVNFRIAATTDQATGALLQPDGKIVIVGVSCPSGQSNGLRDFAIARLNPDGTLDNTFGSVGTVTTSFGFQREDIPGPTLFQPDGKILVGGSSDGVFALARYNPNGTLDNTFGSGGTVMTDFPESLSEGIGILFPQPDGKFIAVGGLYLGGSNPVNRSQIVFVRYNANGSIDTTYGNNGILKLFFENEITSFNGLAIQPDGKILVSGSFTRRIPNCTPTKTTTCDYSVYFLKRYHPNMTLDRKFGRKQGTEVPPDILAGLYPQADGRILIGGFPLVKRYSYSGRFETTFDLANYPNQASSFQNGPGGLTVRPNGTILGCQVLSGGNGYYDIGLVLFDEGGHAIGYEQRNFFGGDDYCTKIMIQSDGKILVVASAQLEPQSNYSFAVLRYLDITQ
ncbi:MAG: delta-60 repeat domain-containing protein [Pyrinomonadaceae bacterium]